MLQGMAASPNSTASWRERADRIAQGFWQPQPLAHVSKAEPEAYRHGTLGHSEPFTIFLCISGSCGHLTGCNYNSITAKACSTVGVCACMAAADRVWQLQAHHDLHVHSFISSEISLYLETSSCATQSPAEAPSARRVRLGDARLLERIQALEAELSEMDVVADELESRG